MRARHLALEDFRSYAALDLELAPATTVLVGANGAGKTNVLEALTIVALGGSPRARDDAEVIRWGAPFARIRVEVEQAEGERRVEALIFSRVEGEQRRPKRFFLDGAGKRAADLAGELRVVAFFPDEVALLAEAPVARRRYLDDMIGQVDRRYRRAVADLGRVVEQRNALLRRAREEGRAPAEDELGFWDEELVRLGGIVAATRSAVVRELAPHFSEAHARISGGLEAQASYVCQVDPTSAAEAAAGYRALLPGRRERELWQGSTLVGPHRDDLAVSAHGRLLPTFASRGEQRSAVLSLKLAEAAWLVARSGDRPVFLLDDVLSELDPDRRERLAAAIPSGVQCLISAASRVGLPRGLTAGAVYLEVVPGAVRPA